MATVWTLCGLHIDIYFYISHTLHIPLRCCIAQHIFCHRHIHWTFHSIKYILIYILQARLLEPLITPVGGVLRHVIYPVRTPRDSCPTILVASVGHQPLTFSSDKQKKVQDLENKLDRVDKQLRKKQNKEQNQTPQDNQQQQINQQERQAQINERLGQTENNRQYTGNKTGQNTNSQRQEQNRKNQNRQNQSQNLN